MLTDKWYSAAKPSPLRNPPYRLGGVKLCWVYWPEMGRCNIRHPGLFVTFLFNDLQVSLKFHKTMFGHFSHSLRKMNGCFTRWKNFTSNWLSITDPSNKVLSLLVPIIRHVRKPRKPVYMLWNDDQQSDKPDSKHSPINYWFDIRFICKCRHKNVLRCL